jgi:hypothetical protein
VSSDSDPRERNETPAGEPRHGDEALGRLEERLDRASEAAERLIAEAATRMVGGQSAPDGGARAAEPDRKPPPAGWQRPQRAESETSSEREPAHADAEHSHSPGEIDLLLHALGALRDRIPPELQHRLGEALREVLLALRALIDWYLERSERQRSEPSEIQDIPIL